MTRPRVIAVDKHAVHPLAFDAREPDGTLLESCPLRRCQDRNHGVEQDHRWVKRRVHPGLGIGAFVTAPRLLQGSETMQRLRKGQIEGVAKGDVLAQNRVINPLFGVATSRALTTLFSHFHECLQHNRFSLRVTPSGDVPAVPGVQLTPALGRGAWGVLFMLPWVMLQHRLESL
jgi:DDE domain